ncbi:MAG: DUF4091 domain-containing protein [Rikenellaceae bacterium]|nr:DUF4091 domain-containing protein [Rikenellaceae bacterium]
MKNHYTNLLAPGRALMAAGLAAGMLATACAPEAPIDVWTVSSYENVFRDAVPDSAATDGFELVVARNEGESFQALLRSGEPFTIDTVVFSDLKGGGKRIAAGNLKYNFVEYVYMGENSWGQNPATVIRNGAGDYPDPLSNDGSIEVKAGETQPVWITLRVPKDAEPGLYTGKATIRTSLGKVKVDLAAEVNDVTVPDATEGNFDFMHHQQIAGTWFYNATRGDHPQDVIRQIYGIERWTPEWWALVGDMADKMHDQRANVLFVNSQQLVLDGEGTSFKNGKYDFDFSKFDQYIQFFMDKKAVNKLEGIHMGSVVGEVGKTFKSYILVADSAGVMRSTNVEPMAAECETFFTQFMPALYDHLREKGWLGVWMQHVGDEAVSDLQHKQYDYYMNILKTYAPEMRCGDPTFTLKSGLSAVKQGATITTPIEELYSACKPTFDSLQQAGITVYGYNCCGPGDSWLNRMIDKPVWNQRLLGWLCYKWGLPGWLHWGWNFWVEWNQDKFHSVDDAAFKGDHYSVYPDVKNNRVKASIRTEAIRDMSEEYELLRILGEKDQARALELVERVARNASGDYTRDTKLMLETRNELVRAAAGK